MNIWSAHLKTDKDKQEFENLVLRAKPVLDRLRVLVENKEEELSSFENSLKAYDNPNWHFRQAHINGYKSCQSRLLKLITLDQEGKHDRSISTSARPEQR